MGKKRSLRVVGTGPILARNGTHSSCSYRKQVRYQNVMLVCLFANYRLLHCTTFPWLYLFKSYLPYLSFLSFSLQPFFAQTANEWRTRPVTMFSSTSPCLTLHLTARFTQPKVCKTSLRLYRRRRPLGSFRKECLLQSALWFLLRASK